jgi:hypothetical protein
LLAPWSVLGATSQKTTAVLSAHCPQRLQTVGSMPDVVIDVFVMVLHATR